MFRASQYNILVDLPDSQSIAIVSGMTGSIDLVDRDLGAALQRPGEAGHISIEHFSPTLREYLLERGYVTASDAHEEAARFQSKSEAMIRGEVERPRKFYLMATYACQLRCTYCFEHSVRSEARKGGWESTTISPELVGAAFTSMETLLRPAETRQCTLFGGEALIPENRKAVANIIHVANDRGFALMAATNAYDLGDYKDLLGPDAIAGIHVPLDGPQAIHDRLRIGKGGAPTFRRILDNIKLALSSGVRVRLRVNVDFAALEQLEALADVLESEGLTRYPSFSSYVKAIFATKHGSTQPMQVVLSDDIRRRLEIGVKPSSDLMRGPRLVTDADVAVKLATSDRLSRIFSAYPVVHNKVDALFAQRVTEALRPSHCGTASLQVLIFDPLGDVYPCNNVVGHANLRVATFHPHLHWEEEAAELWKGRVVSSMPDVRSCKYAMFCGGGCAFDALISHEDVRAKACDCVDFARTFAGMVASSYRRICGDPVARI